jgi:hypothetical protein
MQVFRDSIIKRKAKAIILEEKVRNGGGFFGHIIQEYQGTCMGFSGEIAPVNLRFRIVGKENPVRG